MDRNIAFKDFITTYLKTSSLLKDDQYESDIGLKIKAFASKPEVDKDFIEYVNNIDDLRKTPDVSVRKLITLLTIISFNLVP